MEEPLKRVAGSPGGGMDDAEAEAREGDLLQPSVGRAGARREGPAPWNVSSQLWVAFFGGVTAVTVIAWLNARRLRSTPGRVRGVLGAGAVGLAAVAALYLTVPVDELTWAGFAATRPLRWGSRIVAVAVFLVQAWLQKPAERRHDMFGGGETASLWLPGLGATFILGFLQPLAMIALALAVRG